MFSLVSSVWALLLGFGLIMLGNGLQGTLLGVRATMEEFSTLVIGVMMSGYFI
ncbi:MAG: MFS transporter, partial [Gammaproteobacteria bacterium]|nr:MFS transporter [Gammaproteobacteria bacterium]